MLQFASSDSYAESEIDKAESMSRRNHLHDEMRWRAVGIKTPVGDMGLDAGDSPQRQKFATCWNVPEDTNSATAGFAALCCCRKAHIQPNCDSQTA
ncbi:hypothetical protein AVEN_3218-1 [Araneus ventricosus]|uniref:Uncharacterized protein n=1 Tax=Araneus ventricosus TaxID=182803 RepID=A0A4Y2GAJ9_ARAVE|nr:hypothetical protein AVEN_3218-1 [Araneus ventricosus]